MELLKQIDTKLFLLINNHHCSFCDFIFYRASDKWIWIPFYLLVAFVLFKKFGSGIWKIFLSAAILIFLSDQFSVLIKDCVMRYRPCHNLILQSHVHLINNSCGGLYGFVSSHAANSMALAAFVFMLIGKETKWIALLILAWCLLVAYSRIYLGTHYPADIMGGWITGFVMAWIIFYLYKKFDFFYSNSKNIKS